MGWVTWTLYLISFGIVFLCFLLYEFNRGGTRDCRHNGPFLSVSRGQRECEGGTRGLANRSNCTGSQVLLGWQGLETGWLRVPGVGCLLRGMKRG